MTSTRTGRPTLSVRPASGAVRAVALLLPGGKATSPDPTTERQLTLARMRPFASGLERAGGAHGLVVYTLRYQLRGWNSDVESPVGDAEWALAEVRRRHGHVPAVLIGHSMGGRAALRIAGETGVSAVIGLAPWLPDGEPTVQLRGATVLVVHGTLDRVTSARSSRRYVERARRAGARAGFVGVAGDGHAMLLRPGRWHRLTRDAALGMLGLVREPDWLTAAFRREPAAPIAI